MNRNFVLNGEAVDATVQALYSEISEQLSNEVYYPKHGFTDYEPDIPEEKLSSVSGFGKGVLTVAGQAYGSNQKYKGYSKELLLRKYTSEIDFSEEDIHWLKKAPNTKRVMEFRDNVEGAVNALNANINDDAAKMFYLAHATSFFTGGDSVALASGAHPVRKSGISNQRNIFNVGETHEAFSATSLIKAIERMDRFVLNDGTQMRPCRNLLILHSSELNDTVHQALTSAYGPTTAVLGLNVGSQEFNRGLGRTINHAVIPDQPSGYKDYWAVIDLNRASKMLFMAWGWKPRINNQSEYRKGLFYNEASTLFGPIARDWRYGFYSKGDGSAISS